ncbi:MAG TPA: potassium channel family protein [Candidatus Thermoplasmatota archaeon]|nr:potassium channel family protein [Candidatus Thermoplasmatota archaeon]
MPPAAQPPRPAARQAWRDVLISVLAVVSLAIGLRQISQEETGEFTWLDWIDLGIVAVFWVDFAWEARRHGGLWPYARRRWWEVPSLVPPLPGLVALFPGVALARALRLLRLVRVVAFLLRLRPAGSYVVRLARRARLDAILGVGAIVVLVGTVLAYALESAANARMASWGDATWWAFNMFTNVAYVDFQPITLSGRVLAGILQLCGIAFIGVFTASLAGAIVKEAEPPR